MAERIPDRPNYKTIPIWVLSYRPIVLSAYPGSGSMRLGPAFAAVLPRHALYYACLGEAFDGDEAAKPFRATLNCKKYLRHTTAGDSLDQLIVTKGDTRIHIDESRSK